MEKIDNIKDYFDGNLAFVLFLSDLLYDEEKNSHCIYKKEYINAARVGCISNILLAIKEDLVEKTENVNYESKIFLDELENAVELLATKTNSGYSVNNYEFKDAPTFVAEIRNKIAHGDFRLDLLHTRIVINKDGRDIVININKLSAFIMSAAVNFSKRVSKKEYTRSLFITQKQEKNRIKPITSKEELKRFIKTYYEIRFDLKKNDGTSVDKYVVKEFDKIITNFKKDLDLKKLINFKNKVKDEYTFDWKKIKIDGKKLEKAAESIINITPTNIYYPLQTLSISHELISWLNPEYQKYNPILASSNNLLILDSIYKSGSCKKKDVLEHIVNNYGNLYINHNNIATTAISLFNSLFSYPFDDVYINKNEFTNNPNTGLDYSLLDLNLMNVEKYTIETSTKNDLMASIISKYKELRKLVGKHEDLIVSLKKVKEKNNIKALNKLNDLIYIADQQINVKKNEIRKIDNKLFQVLRYINNNKKYLKNKSIIEGIRNSIAHGNYKVELDENMENSKIIFEDIYNEEITFKGTISIQKFLQMIISNVDVVEEFIHKKKQENTIVNSNYIKVK